MEISEEIFLADGKMMLKMLLIQLLKPKSKKNFMILLKKS
jgi:hypothetical protein